MTRFLTENRRKNVIRMFGGPGSGWRLETCSRPMIAFFQVLFSCFKTPIGIDSGCEVPLPGSAGGSPSMLGFAFTFSASLWLAFKYDPYRARQEPRPPSASRSQRLALPAPHAPSASRSR